MLTTRSTTDFRARVIAPAPIALVAICSGLARAKGGTTENDERLQHHSTHQSHMSAEMDHAAARRMQASIGHGMHEEANAVLLEPGKTADVVWIFPV